MYSDVDCHKTTTIDIRVEFHMLYRCIHVNGYYRREAFRMTSIDFSYVFLLFVSFFLVFMCVVVFFSLNNATAETQYNGIETKKEIENKAQNNNNIYSCRWKRLS